ncbi:MAG: phosphatidylglycerophosphatase A [Candidatus Latescibacteria bacterium]|nr:phosphatidylglycerophosphatase A [Candidatus Latescibacterota bacterium]
MNALATLVATFLYTGFFPFAPATFATAVFLIVYWLVPGGQWLAHWAVLIVTVLVSIPAATRVERARGKDPGCVVIDEVVGIQVVLVGAEPTLAGVAAAFVLFRLFDIWKPYPIHRLQSLPGGWGVVADDGLAGVYARVVMAAASALTPALGRFLP